MNEQSEFLTSSDILRIFEDQSVNRIYWILKSRRHIKPAITAGTVRLYSRDVIDLVRREIDLMDERGTTACVA